MSGIITSVCISEQKHTQKRDVKCGLAILNMGLQGDAHAGFMHRQVSFLADESIEKMKQKGLSLEKGDFGENFTTSGMDIKNIPIGTIISAGDCIFRISQIGKECHTRCAIFYAAGECIMPEEGVFAEVLRGGAIKAGDEINIIGIKPTFSVIVTSDRTSKGETIDESGKALILELEKNNFFLVGYEIVPDEKEELKKKFTELAGISDLIFTSGGTGLTPRDITPDATMEIAEKLIPGIAELIRYEGFKKTPRAALSRAVAALYKKSVIINLPGSKKGAIESLNAIIPILEHTIETTKGKTKDCGR